MSELPSFEIFAAASVIAILVAIVEFLSGSLRPAGRGLVSVVIGLCLLGAGIVISQSPEADPLPGSIWPANFGRDVCYLGGVIFLVTGFLRRVATGSRHASVRRLHDAIGQMSRELGDSREALNSVIQSSISGVMSLQAVRDENGSIVDFDLRLINKEAEQLLGLSARVLKQDRLLRHLPCLKEEGLFQEAISVVETQLRYGKEFRCRHGGRERWYQIAVVKHGDGIVATFADVSDRKQVEDRLRHAAHHDTLTGTPNRSLFTARLEQAIKRASRLPGYKFAVLFMDVDRFKMINDTYGHEAGDQLLISISERLRGNLRTMDAATRVGEGQHVPARLGGDEFAVLLDGIHDVKDAVLVAERIQKALQQPHKIAGQDITATCSVGIVTSDGNYERPDEILRDADTAMYQAKHAGKARHVVFDEKMHSEAMKRLNLEKELRHAAEHKEFKLVYQPIVALDSRGLLGFEALLRWVHPERDVVLPVDFIRLAEELDLIIPIGRWVLNEASRQLREWQRKRPDLVVSVNISKQQLAQSDLVSSVESVLHDTRIVPSTLLMEITESTMMESADTMIPVLRQLREIGVLLAMDDFGTGQSSLGFLHSVPMDILKIDRSFIKTSTTKRDSAAISRTIVQLAQNLDMKVVAEGIETREQLGLLQRLKCHYGQGFLFGEPMSPEASAGFLEQGYTFNLAA